MRSSGSVSRGSGRAAARGTRPAVVKATMISPLPSAAYDPVWPSPRAQRRARRVHCRELSGAFVASTTMHEPSRCLERHEVGDLAPHRNAVDREPLATAVVGEHEHADHEGALAGDGETRRRADAALEVVTGHADAGADRALVDGARSGGVERGMHVLAKHVHAAHVVQEAVVALANDRHDDVVLTQGADRAP